MENNKKPEVNKNTKGNVKKPSNKLKTAPPVRQTLTSYKRMLKANPLLKYQEAGIDVNQLLRLKSGGISLKEVESSEVENSKTSFTVEGLGSKDFKKPVAKPLSRTQSLKLQKPIFLDKGVKKTTIISGNLPLTNDHFKRPLISNTFSNRTNTEIPEYEITSKHLSSDKTEYSSTLEVKAIFNYFPNHSILSKSMSEPRIYNAKLRHNGSHDLNHPAKEEFLTLRISRSLEELQSKKGEIFTQIIPITSNDLEFVPPAISPIMKKTSARINQYTLRSVRRNSLFEASTPASVETQRLLKRLNKWLKLRGKHISSIQHLRYFDFDPAKKMPSPKHIREENKENIDMLNEQSENNENLKIVTTPELNKEGILFKNDIAEEDLVKFAKEAMVELQMLVQEDYPTAQCLGWLELIRDKYRKADSEPEYWECKAAIEQSVGNIGNAVEFYKTAIIQGAKVSTIDTSLDQLLKRFSLLDIRSNSSEQNTTKDRIVREARNVFKSTIIQFAIQERKLKHGVV